jgi:nitrite reductase/ring-hydroxylating ferredoxin subunit
MKAKKHDARRIRYRTRLEREPSSDPMYFWIAEKTEILVIKIGNSVKIFNSICPHMGARLCYQTSLHAVVCPWHGLSYDAETLKSDHSRYRHLAALDGEVVDGELIIYG